MIRSTVPKAGKLADQPWFFWVVSGLIFVAGSLVPYQ